jgi:hypothetical protein
MLLLHFVFFHTFCTCIIVTVRAVKAQGSGDIESSWNVMAHCDAREGKWRWTWRMEWVASTLHTTAEHGVSSITTADSHMSAASIRLNWRPRRYKWSRSFRRKMPSHFKRSLLSSVLIFVTTWRGVVRHTPQLLQSLSRSGRNSTR